MPWITTAPSDLDLDVHSGRQVETLQGVDRLGSGIVDIDEALVNAPLELLP
jgi:hypothetical protein